MTQLAPDIENVLLQTKGEVPSIEKSQAAGGILTPTGGGDRKVRGNRMVVLGRSTISRVLGDWALEASWLQTISRISQDSW